MKKLFAFTAALALTGGMSAFAVNPFSDVSTDDWAYQAVSDLSDQGVVEGYPDGTFKGEKNITRYEMAQIIARLMAREDQLSGEQRAILDRLAGEYADELANLGVRVAALEKKVGNFHWSGDAKIGYTNVGIFKDWNQSSEYNYKNEYFYGRLHINVRADVNENTYFVGRLGYSMDFKNNSDSADEQYESDSVYMDRIYAGHRFGDKVEVRLGRFPLTFGNQGGWLYGDGITPYGNISGSADGIEARFGDEKYSLTAGFVRLCSSYAGKNQNYVYHPDLFYAKAAADFKVAKLDLNVLKLTGDRDDDEEFTGLTLYGAGLMVPVQKFRVFGEYWHSNMKNTAEFGNTAWNAGIGYGKLNPAKPGSWELDLAYNHIGSGVSFGYGSWESTTPLYATYGIGKAVKFWRLAGKVALMKNVYLNAEYDFNVKLDANRWSDATDDDGNSLGRSYKGYSSWAVSLNYVF